MTPAQQLRQQWEHRLSFFAMRFADARQTYPRVGDKNTEGKSRPSPTTDRNNPETNEMNTTTESNTSNGQQEPKFENVTPGELAALMGDVKEELKRSRSLKAKSIDAAVHAAAVGIGVSVGLFLATFFVKPTVPVPMP
jgi:hypothetical protein